MSDEGNAAEADINELLGADSDGELEITETANVNEHQGPKGGNSEIADLLGDSEDEDDVTMSKDDGQRTMDEFYSRSDNTESRADDLEQILGKADVRLGGSKEAKAKTQSKISMQPTYKVPPKHSTLFVRTPNFIKIQPTEYDEHMYEADGERKLFDGSTAVVRWRTKRDANGHVVCDAQGKPVKESNARMLRWSDGTVQLVVGDAVFQCKSLDVENCYVYEQQVVMKLTEGEDSNAPSSVKDSVLECLGEIHQRLVLQPMSLDSESHARMSMKISEKFKKESKIRDRDYEQISERPEKTLADLAKQADEADRRDRKLRDGQSTKGNTITGAARFSKRPAMSADYLVGEYDDYEDEEADEEEPEVRGRPSKPPAGKDREREKVKAPRKKAPVSADYPEDDEDEDEGSEAMEDEDEDEDEEMDEGDEEDDEDEMEERSENSSDGDDDGAEGESSDDGARKPKSPKKKSSSGSKEASSKDKKERKRDKKERRRRKEEKRAARKEEKEAQRKKRKAARQQEGAGGDGAERTAAAVGNTGVGAGEGRGSGEEEDEEVNVQQRKRAKRTIMDSDEDE